MPYYYNPQSGGNKIPISSHDKFRAKAKAFEKKCPWFPQCQLSLRFKGRFCYIDVTKQGETEPWPLTRLRYFHDNVWSMAFYTWSNERYEPCILLNGKWEGSIEEAIETCELFLTGVSTYN